MNIAVNNLTEIEQVNIQKIEAHFGNDYILTSKHNLAYNCPFCEENRGKADYDHKFMVDAKTTMYWCFKCHTKGLLIKSSVSKYLILLFTTNCLFPICISISASSLRIITFWDSCNHSTDAPNDSVINLTDT